jgi:hypothetical protein
MFDNYRLSGKDARYILDSEMGWWWEPVRRMILTEIMPLACQQRSKNGFGDLPGRLKTPKRSFFGNQSFPHEPKLPNSGLRGNFFQISGVPIPQ